MEQSTIVQFVRARGRSYKLQWPCTRRGWLDILMSRITHNNQDVIFQLPTQRTAEYIEKYYRQRTHRTDAQKRRLDNVAIPIWTTHCFTSSLFNTKA